MVRMACSPVRQPAFIAALAILTGDDDDDEEALSTASSPTVCIMQVDGRQRDGRRSVAREEKSSQHRCLDRAACRVSTAQQRFQSWGRAGVRLHDEGRRAMERLSQLEPDPRPASLPRLWALTPTGRTAARMGAGDGHGREHARTPSRRANGERKAGTDGSATPLPGWKTKPGMTTELCGAVADGYVRAEGVNNRRPCRAGRAGRGGARHCMTWPRALERRERMSRADRDAPGTHHVAGAIESCGVRPDWESARSR